MYRVLTALALVGVSVPLTLSAQPHPMRPGRWEVSVSMQMAAMTMPPTTMTQCVTADDIKKAAEGGMPGGLANNQPPNCKVADYKLTGNTVSWKMECTGANAMSGEGRMTFNGDTYDGTVSMTTPQGAMTMKSTGKRIGDCTK